jgi:ABC-type dipeptide/oligopeptide/nickel transport system ATPase subunit
MGQIVLHQVSKTYPGGVRSVDELSGGQRQRVAMGRAVDPDSLYFFDPDSGRAIGADWRSSA